MKGGVKRLFYNIYCRFLKETATVFTLKKEQVNRLKTITRTNCYQNINQTLLKITFDMNIGVFNATLPPSDMLD